ncbi:hypothetical protein QP027_00740 [Corynebacterium breve]|uniref:Core-binding (CB) domain-containing protein n=1 Tax=Corynebacterium breve TaxID=3049799 RepID=A0ABY8VGR2_9CORY|nr:hypothetical protein [Corynebacterium breve]WIM67960.1 hypothetical protein QP027_00740 [Corynebacterium breve]
MAHVRDLWTKPNPDKTSRKKRVCSARWGVGRRWQVIWDENGKRTTATFQTEDAANDYKARVEVGQTDGTWITKDKAAVTFGDLWDPWIESKPDIAQSTRAGYVAAWAHLEPVWGDTCIAKFNAAVFPTWVAGLKTRRPHQKTEPTPLGSGAKRKVGIVVNAFLDMAVKNKIIRENPLGKGDIVRQEPADKRALRIGEVDALLAAAPTEQARLLAEVMPRTGIRPGKPKGSRSKTSTTTVAGL